MPEKVKLNTDMITKKHVLLFLGLILAIAIAGFLFWANNSLPPMPEALSAMQSDSQVRVTEDGWIVFQPLGVQPDTGVILYPGGRVDPRAYAPAARAIAEQGYQVIIVPMPLNLAVLAADRAEEVIAAYPDIAHWVIGGHSLGGAMAARFADQHPAEIRGLFLWAAYPPDSNDLSDQASRVVSIIGSQDGLGTGEGVNSTQHLLPQDTQFVVIEGGNHAQFGWYGEQPGDADAAISRTDQQAQTLKATLEMLDRVK
jgi:pimeloyl-ACP methyl ester carboxylesterase